MEPEAKALKYARTNWHTNASINDERTDKQLTVLPHKSHEKRFGNSIGRRPSARPAMKPRFAQTLLHQSDHNDETRTLLKLTITTKFLQSTKP